MHHQLDSKDPALGSYLSALSAIADCIGSICPEIGALYRNRLTRYRARVAFDSSPQAVERNCTLVQAELRECASRAAEFVQEQAAALRSAFAIQERTVRTLALKQNVHARRLSEIAASLGTAEVPADVEESQQMLAVHAAGLLSYADQMKAETESLLARMQQEMENIERRVAEADITDPVTGLLNRREMERRIEARKRAGELPVLLQFHLSGAVTDEVARQAAARLNAMFRPQDLVSRWSDTDFLVLFEGAAAIAQARGERIVPWIAGPYLVNREPVDIGVEVWLMHPQLVAQSVLPA